MDGESYCMMRRMPAARRCRTDRVLLAVLAVALFLFLLGIEWGLPNTHPWNGDDISPDKPLRVVWNWFFGWHKYPYLHWWISFALYSPYLAWLALRGELDVSCFPRFEAECFADPFAQLTVLMVLSRLLAVAMALGIVGLTAATARTLGLGRAAVGVAAAAAACAPVLVFFAHTGNLDVPQTFWFSVWLLFFARVVRFGTVLDHVGFGLSLGAAVATKEGIGGAFVLPALAVYGLHLRRARAAGTDLLRATFDRRLWWLAGAAVGLYVLVQNPLFNAEGFARHLEAWNPSGERMTGFRTGFTGWGRFLRRLAITVGEGAGPLAASLAALAALVTLALRQSVAWLWLPALSYLGVSLLTARFAPVRFTLPLVPILAVFLGAAVETVWRRPRFARALVAAAVACALAQSLLLSLNLDLFLRNDSRYLAEAWLRENVAPGDRVAVFAPDRYLPRLEWLGHEIWEVPEGQWSGAGLAAGAPRWIVLSDRYHPRFSGERGAFFAALKRGELGWRVAWEGRGTTFLEPWLGDPGLVGAINPYFTILGQPAPAAAAPVPAPPTPPTAPAR
jgi:hypothetical protein